MAAEPHLVVEHLTLAYGGLPILRDLSFSVRRGAIFFITGGSGSGKSTVLRALLGLHQETSGSIRFDGNELVGNSPEEQSQITRRFGVLFQGGALWSSMTVAENVELPL